MWSDIRTSSVGEVVERVGVSPSGSDMGASSTIFEACRIESTLLDRASTVALVDVNSCWTASKLERRWLMSPSWAAKAPIAANSCWKGVSVVAV